MDNITPTYGLTSSDTVGAPDVFAEEFGALVACLAALAGRVHVAAVLLGTKEVAWVALGRRVCSEWGREGVCVCVCVCV